jgi:type I restriction enzyme M protein
MAKAATIRKKQKRKKVGENGSATLPMPALAEGHLDISALKTWLWDAACAIRGATDAPKFKEFLLPLIFFKRLSDVFDDEFAAKAKEFGEEESAREIIQADHTDALRTGRNPIVRFFIPHQYCWEAIRNHPSNGELGQFVTSAMRDVARLNPDLQGVLDIKDYNERRSGQRTIDDDRLSALIEVLSRHKLGLSDAEPDILGRAYEYLLGKFAEPGESAGEFYTPREVGWLIAHIIDPQPYATIYDPACGSGGLLIKARLFFEQRHAERRSQAPRLFLQELNPDTFAIAKTNMFLHDYTDSVFAVGDTLRKPRFAAEGAGLKRFDYVVANPMWNQTGYDEAFYENDQWKRFGYGAAPSSSADWGWLQHIAVSLKDNGRAAVVLDTGAISRGSGSKSSNKEKLIRQGFVEADLIEGVILLPENLFYNTPSPGIVLVLNRNKPTPRKGQFLLVNASAYFVREKPKNVLTDEGIAAASDVFHRWETQDKLSRVITLEQVREADYNLSPSLFVETNDKTRHRPLAQIFSDLTSARESRQRADLALDDVLAKLGLGISRSQ